MTTAVAIKPTKHAIDRFRERVLINFSEEIQIEYRKFKNLKKLINQVKLHVEDIKKKRNGILHVNVFLQIDDLIIPLTYVINPRENLIITIYLQSGWEFDTSSYNTILRWRI